MLRIPGKTHAKPLPIAAQYAKAGDAVFIIGGEAKAPGKPGCFRAKVAFLEGGGIVYAVEDKFDAWGFGGVPVVNLQGEVVGTILAGDDKGKHLLGLSAATLRATLKAAEVELE